MAQTNINIRMDEGLKQQFDALCSELGMNMTTAINIFAKTMVRQQRIPFEVSLASPHAETMGGWAELDEMRSNPQKYKRYHSFADAMEEVLGDV